MPPPQLPLKRKNPERNSKLPKPEQESDSYSVSDNGSKNNQRNRRGRKTEQWDVYVENAAKTIRKHKKMLADNEDADPNDKIKWRNVISA